MLRTAAAVTVHQDEICCTAVTAACLPCDRYRIRSPLMQEGGRGMLPGSKGKEPDASKEKPLGESGFGDRWTAG